MLGQTDSRRRVTLPPSVGVKPGDALDLEIPEDGRIILTPVEPIPRHQLRERLRSSQGGTGQPSASAMARNSSSSST